MKKQIFDALIKKKSQLFHEKTKISYFSTPKSIAPSKWPEAWKKPYYKAYPRLESISLPKPTANNVPLINALIDRKSERNFSKKSIDLISLSTLLYFSVGLKSHLCKSYHKSRFYPSAGALYPIEIYPICINVNGFSQSITHYHLKTHSLEILLKPPFKRKLLKQFRQPWIRKSSIIIVLTGIFERTQIKYGERGYRHVLTDVGQIIQNVSLLSTSLNISCCAVGGSDDLGLQSLLDLDIEDEEVLGVLCLGNKYPYKNNDQNNIF